jgi:hypothetical protein
MRDAPNRITPRVYATGTGSASVLGSVLTKTSSGEPTVLPRFATTTDASSAWPAGSGSTRTTLRATPRRRTARPSDAGLASTLLATSRSTNSARTTSRGSCASRPTPAPSARAISAAGTSSTMITRAAQERTRAGSASAASSATGAISASAHSGTHRTPCERRSATWRRSQPGRNAIKYIWRADEKGKAIEDLRKAAWYVDREIERRLAAEGP